MHQHVSLTSGDKKSVFQVVGVGEEEVGVGKQGLETQRRASISILLGVYTFKLS